MEGGRNQNTIRNDINWDDVERIGLRDVHGSQDADRAEDSQASGSGNTIGPSFEWLFEGAGNDGRTPDDAFHVTLIFLDVLLSKILGKGIGIRKVTNKLLLIILHILQTHVHDLAHGLLDILIVLVNSLVHFTALPIAVDVSS